MNSADAARTSSRPLAQLTLARLREFIREPEAIFWAFFFPIVISVAMAFAFPSREDQPIPVGVEEGPGAADARRALAASSAVEVRDLSSEQLQRALRDGEVHLIVVPGDPPVYRFDPAREESRLARYVVDEALKRAAGRADPFTAGEQRAAIPGSRYIDWLVPGLVGLGIMNNGMWGVAFVIVQTRMRKVLKLLVASPMRRQDYLVAQVLARLIFLGPEAAIPLVFGALVLGVPIAGSIGAIAVVVLVGGLMFAAIALLAASRVRTWEAISGILNLAQTPMWLLSGVFFSASNFPDPVQPFIRALPLTPLIDALRAVILDGATIAAVRTDLAIMGAWTVVPFALALYLFRWR